MTHTITCGISDQNAKSNVTRANVNKNGQCDEATARGLAAEDGAPTGHGHNVEFALTSLKQ